MNWLIHRLQEPSTWIGALLFAQNIAPAVAHHDWVSVGGAVVGAAGVVLKEAGAADTKAA